MARNTPSSRSRKDTAQSNPPADGAPLDDFLQQQIRWFDQVTALQTAWLTSCLALQADCWRLWAAGSPQLPAWMVWQNGAEQIA